jgi:hypothetical protein
VHGALPILMPSPNDSVTEPCRRRYGPLFWIAAIGGIAFATLYVFAWPIQAATGELLFVLLSLPITGLLAFVSLPLSLVYIARHGYRMRHAFGPVAFNVAIVLGVLLGMASDAKARIYFAITYGSRQAVVAQILSGDIASPGPEWDSGGRVIVGNGRPAPLPPQYRHLSFYQGHAMTYSNDGGRHVVFFATKGLFQGFTGWAYREDGKPPVPSLGALHGPAFCRVTPLASHWYWVLYCD